MGAELRTRNPKAKIESISEAATELFVLKGFIPTTLAEIAKQAKVSKGTIILHFGSKENLAKELIILHRDAQVTHQAKRTKNYSSVEERVKRGIADYVLWCAANPYPATFLLGLRHNELLHSMDTVPDLAHARAARLLKQGQEEGTVRPGSPKFLAHVMAAPASKMVRLALEWNRRTNFEELAETLGDLAWKIVRNDED
jgi:AcrR family transcriptional regulator